VWVQQTWLRIARALVLALGGTVLASRLTRGVAPGQHTSTHFVADDLNDLSTDELRDVLTAFDEMISSDSVAVPEGSTDLHELRRAAAAAVLRSLEDK